MPLGSIPLFICSTNYVIELMWYVGIFVVVSSLTQLDKEKGFYAKASSLIPFNQEELRPHSVHLSAQFIQLNRLSLIKFSEKRNYSPSGISENLYRKRAN